MLLRVTSRLLWMVFDETNRSGNFDSRERSLTHWQSSCNRISTMFHIKSLMKSHSLLCRRLADDMSYLLPVYRVWSSCYFRIEHQLTTFRRLCSDIRIDSNRANVAISFINELTFRSVPHLLIFLFHTRHFSLTRLDIIALQFDIHITIFIFHHYE